MMKKSSDAAKVNTQPTLKTPRRRGVDLPAERLTPGYTQVLRPRLVAGRFRFAGKTPALFLNRRRNSLPAGVKCALSGGQAVDLLRGTTIAGRTCRVSSNPPLAN